MHFVLWKRIAFLLIFLLLHLPMAGELLLTIALSLITLPLSSSSFSPIFLSCGSPSAVYFAGDNPPRNFTSDDSFLLSPSTSETDPSSSSPLYSTARLFTSPSSYSFNVDGNAYYILRLHFFPFASTSSARFNVSALDRYLLLHSFSPPPSTSTIKEFLLWVDSSALLLTFSPVPNSIAFINALELIASPPYLFRGIQPFYVTASDSSPASNFFPQAMETARRINVGGPRITPANDTLWRTWETDDDFLFEMDLSVENYTSGAIKYSKESAMTSLIAPEMVYRTARTMNVNPIAGMTSFRFNLTWSFDVPPGFQYLVRMHFCNSWFPNHPTFYFETYLSGFSAARDLKPGDKTDWNSMVPFYLDFVVDLPAMGSLNVSIGPAITSVPLNAFLNGLEIIKLSNSHLSLAGDFGLIEADTESKNKKHLLIILLPTVIVGLLLLLLPFAYLLWRHRRRKLSHPAEDQKDSTHKSWSQMNAEDEAGIAVLSSLSKSATEESSKNPPSTHIKLGLQISIDDIILATSNFDEKLVVGSGGFGKVYRGVLRDGTKVAVKRCEPGSRQGFPEFQTEIVVLSQIRHWHLVSLIGYCNEQSEMILVYEYMENGTLRSYLYGSDLPCLSWKQRLEICICAARGLHYLHTGYSQSIIHRDVKSTNILLGENYAAKVSDFGLSRLGPSVGETHVSTDVKGTFGYLDPEYFKIQKLTEKSDVYSFGVVLFEVLCARPAISEHVNLAELGLHWVKKGQLEKIVDRRLTGNINENSLKKFGETAAKCLADYGVDRPSIGDVLWNLEYALQLQATQLRREPFEDSGVVDEPQTTVSAAMAGMLPSMGMDLEVEAVTRRTAGEMESSVFSQLVETSDGR